MKKGILENIIIFLIFWKNIYNGENNPPLWWDEIYKPNYFFGIRENSREHSMRAEKQR